MTALDLAEVEANAKAALVDTITNRSTAFLVKTNNDLDGWMSKFYAPDSEMENFRLYSLWAWQENEKRNACIIVELISMLNAKGNVIT